MKENRLIIKINKSVGDLFAFTTTPPNSTLWIPSVIKEETSEWPVGLGTIYRLQDEKGEISEVTITAIKENERVEWVSKDKTYHCRYLFKPLDKNSTEFEYIEWVDKGDIKDPFTIEILEKLKSAIES